VFGNRRVGAWSVVFVALAWLALMATSATAQTPTVLTARVNGPIIPVVADHLVGGVRTAERLGHIACEWFAETAVSDHGET
jgi:membrane-bound ClpP family serine protease